MGMKYMIFAFDYPFKGYEKTKQCRFLISALLWFIVFSVKYDGVDFQKRGNA